MHPAWINGREKENFECMWLEPKQPELRASKKTYTIVFENMQLAIKSWGIYTQLIWKLILRSMSELFMTKNFNNVLILLFVQVFSTQYKRWGRMRMGGVGAFVTFINSSGANLRSYTSKEGTNI